jgi:hypothetical protein
MEQLRIGAFMPLTIDKETTLAAAERLAKLTHDDVSEAVDKAIKDKLARLEAPSDKDWEERWKRIEALQAELAELPKLDPRSPQEIADDLYDERGLPK